MANKWEEYFGTGASDYEFPQSPTPGPASTAPQPGAAPTPGPAPTPAPTPTPAQTAHPQPQPQPGSPAPGPNDVAVPRNKPAGGEDPRCPGVSARACQSHHEINSTISLAQWQAWDQYVDPSCPPSHPYRSQKEIGGATANTCEESPDNCPPGYIAFGRNECVSVNDKRVGGGGNTAASSGGGGGGSRTTSSASISPGAGSTAFGADLEKMIRDLMNSPSRYSPQALQALYGEIARQSSGQITRGERSVRADAARRGMSRAGSTAAGIRAVQAGAEAQRGQAIVGVQTAKIQADFQDKLAGLDRAQKYLDSLRDNEYRYTLVAEQRRQFDANLALGYANLNQQRAMLNSQLQSQWDMLRAQQNFQLLRPGVM